MLLYCIQYTTIQLFIFGHVKLFRMLQHTKYQLKGQNKHPIRKAHYVGTSVVLTLDPTHVKRLSIDEMTGTYWKGSTCWSDLGRNNKNPGRLI